MPSPENNNAEKSVALIQKEKQELAVINRPLVLSIAKELQDCGLAWEDLVGHGNIGLVYAANRFDPNLGYKFSTYATRCIRGEMLNALNKRGSVHVFRKDMQEGVKLMRARGHLTAQLGHEPTVDELAQHMQMDTDRIEELLAVRLALNVSSLHTSINEDGWCLEDVVANDAPTPEDEVLEADATVKRKQIIRKACSRKLSSRDRKILSMRFGLGRCKEGTILKDIGKLVGLSRQGVRLAVETACQKLKKVSQMRQAYEETA